MNASPHPHAPHLRFRPWFWMAGIILFFVFLSLISSILLPFVVGMLAAYFLDPAVRRLHRWGWSRATAAGVITIGFFLSALILCIMLAPPVINQLIALVSKLPDYMHQMQAKYGDSLEYYLTSLSADQAGAIKSALSNFSTTLVGFAGRLAGSMLQSGFAFLNILMLIFITPVVAFYLLRDWDRLVTHFNDLLPRDHAQTIREQLHAIDSTLAGFIRGQINVCLILAAYYGILLPIIGLNFGLVIGIMTGILLFVPFVGFATCFLLSVIVAFFQFGAESHLFAVLTVYGIGAVLENSLITPRLVGSQVGLHPLWIIFGMLAGGTLFGFVGILISVPVTAIAGVLVRFAAARYLESSLYSGK